MSGIIKDDGRTLPDPTLAVTAGPASWPPDYDWHNVADKLPDIPVIVWVSCGGGTALLARYDRYRWENATSIRPLPFIPTWWQHLRLPEFPPNK